MPTSLRQEGRDATRGASYEGSTLMDEQTHVTIPTVDVWVMPHDDERVRWVINDRDDMLGNYADMLGEGIDPGTFEEYLDTWTHLVMPVPVWQSDLLSRRFVERAMRGPK